MVVKAAPTPAFVVTEAQIAFSTMEVLLDMPTGTTQAQELHGVRLGTIE